MVIIKKLYYDARPTKYQDLLTALPAVGFQDKLMTLL